MRRAAMAAALALAVGGLTRADEKDVIDLDGLKSKAPAEWKMEAPANKMRFAQYRLPAARGDKDDAELVIFKGLSGSAKQNVERWKGQFVPPEGKKIDDVASVADMKLAGHEATYLDVSGTYKFKSAPFDPQAKEERKAGYRMLAVQFDGPKDVYHIKLTGPEATVAMYKKGFDEWLKALK